MITNTPPPEQRLTGIAASETTDSSYIDWPAILAGGVFALALGFLLISFGASLGLSLTSPYRGEGVSAGWLAIAAGIWFAWVMVTSFGAGGYLAGRMRRRAGDATAPEVEVRDGTHGLMVWATGALAGAVLAATGVGGLVGVGASAAGSAADLASEAAEAVNPDYFANVMLRGSASDQAETAAESEAATGGETEAATATGTTTSPDGQTTDGEALAQTPAPQPTAAPEQTATAQAIDPAVQQQVATIIVRSAARGEMPERDRSHLAQLVASNTDLDQDDARTRVDEVNAEIDAARAEALEAVEQARVAGVVFGFIAAATLLIGAVAAFFAAAAGGRHRDEGLGFDAFTAPR